MAQGAKGSRLASPPLPPSPSSSPCLGGPHPARAPRTGTSLKTGTSTGTTPARAPAPRRHHAGFGTGSRGDGRRHEHRHRRQLLGGRQAARAPAWGGSRCHEHRPGASTPYGGVGVGAGLRGDMYREPSLSQKGVPYGTHEHHLRSPVSSVNLFLGPYPIYSRINRLFL
jgi:hypothetical protein